jgi:hypothetical protein
MNAASGAIVMATAIAAGLIRERKNSPWGFIHTVPFLSKIISIAHIRIFIINTTVVIIVTDTTTPIINNLFTSQILIRIQIVLYYEY